MFLGKRAVLTLGLLSIILNAAYGQSSFTRGEEFFLQNKPQEALAFLESAVAEDPGNIRAYLYLGVSYQQLQRPDEAIVVYRRALPQAGQDTALIAFNLGNIYYAKNNIPQAEEYYTQALTANPSYGSAYLNRANARLSRQALREAVADYEAYLSKEPDSPKRGRVQQLLVAIRADFATAERDRILAEAQAAAEADRKRRILEDAAASLQSAVDDTKGLSSGSEDVLGYDGEFELE
ncbi:hypothetical protein FACS1894137_11450 [Spirochaetia bacterium]|nr:hypothetical protein FACS1894137_11450 [Spirochaetia bacterium]